MSKAKPQVHWLPNRVWTCFSDHGECAAYALVVQRYTELPRYKNSMVPLVPFDTVTGKAFSSRRTSWRTWPLCIARALSRTSYTDGHVGVGVPLAESHAHLKSFSRTFFPRAMCMRAKLYCVGTSTGCGFSGFAWARVILVCGETLIDKCTSTNRAVTK